MTKKKMDPEKERKLGMIVYGMLTAVMFASLILIVFLAFNIVITWAEYAAGRIVELKASELLEFPLNETRTAMATSEISLVFSIVAPMLIGLALMAMAAFVLGTVQLGNFIRIWRRIPTLKERIEKLEEAAHGS